MIELREWNENSMWLNVRAFRFEVRFEGVRLRFLIQTNSRRTQGREVCRPFGFNFCGIGGNRFLIEQIEQRLCHE